LRVIYFFFFLLLFLLLFLGLVSAGFQFLVEPIYDLEIWNSPIWQTVRIPAIVLAVVLGLTLLIVVTSRSSKKAERLKKQFALSQGWVYTAGYHDTDGVVRSVAAILGRVSPDTEFDVRTVMTVRHGEGNAFLLDCLYRERGSRFKHDYGSACLIESDRFVGVGSEVYIAPRSGLDALVPRKVDMGDTEFARNFIVCSRQPEEALKAVNESIQSFLLEQKIAPSSGLDSFSVTLGPGGIVVLRGSVKANEEWPALLHMARRIESALE